MSDERIHPIQADILRRLFEQDGLRFAQINVAKIPTDQFSYHLRQLAKEKLIQKLPDQTYQLTALGKSRTIMLKPDHNSFIAQGFTAVLTAATKVENGQTYYYLQQRDKVPYQGSISIPGDKVYYGESTLEAATRAFTIQSGLSGSPELRSIWHLREVHEDEVVQDKYFYVYMMTGWRGEIQPEGLTGTNMWMTLDDLQASGHAMYSCIDIIKSLDEPLSYHESITEIEAY